MKISVIIPIYNVEKYLIRCLKSIVNQTLKEIEIILVNDGSTDNSNKICSDFAINDSRIRIINKKNGGLSDARNFGLEVATGDYISFIDSDDYVDLSMLESMCELALKYNVDIVTCNLVKVNELNEEFKKLPQSNVVNNYIDLKKDFSYFGEMSCFACNKLFKKELFLNQRFKKGLHFEDIELIPKLILESKKIIHSNNYFYKYFERQDSISKSYTRKGLDIFKAIENVTSTFKISNYNYEVNELKRFQILQGFYSFLAYVAYVKDKELKQEMLSILNNKIKEYSISRIDILKYNRFGENYLLSLEFKKIIYYLIGITNIKWLKYI